MSTHTMLPGRHAHEGPGPVPRGAHPGSRATWAVPAVAAFVYGLYVVFISHENGFSEAGGWLLGLVAAVVSFAVGYALVRGRDRMITEVRAAAFGALFGICMGFLHNLGGGSVLRSAGIGLTLGIGMGLTAYYVFYVHEH
ncbi:hypothetical protein [Streptomyces sp. NPDC049555]|uniref:hypothetical protein n=1 Tax=Streptomyces sp. NPDC049555 TaxID=3154930 RepID=UPI00342FF514